MIYNRHEFEGKDLQTEMSVILKEIKENYLNLRICQNELLVLIFPVLVTVHTSAECGPR